MNFKQIDRRLITILLIVFVQMLGASMALPILPLFAQRTFDLDAQTIARLVSSFFAAQFLAGPLIGRLSDKYGRIPVLIVSQIGTTISFVMLGAAQGAIVLFAARILDGITGGNIIAAQAYVTDITPREKRTQSLGYIFAAFGLGFIFGPVLGGALSAIFGPRVPFYVAAAAALLVTLLTHFTLDESLTAEQRAANRKSRSSSLSPTIVIRNMSLLFILLIAFVGQFGLGLLQSTFALYAQAVLFVERSREATDLGVGVLLAFVGISQFFTQTYLLPRILPRFGEARLVIAGNVLRALGSFIFAIVTSAWIAPLGSLAFAMGMGLVMPSLQSLSTNTVDDEVRGGVLGLFQSTINLSTIFSTYIAGDIFNIGPTMPYWIGGALTTAVIPLAIILYRQTVKQKA